MSVREVPDDRLVLLVDCKNELEGQELRSVLEDSGLIAFVFEKETLGIGLTSADSRLNGVQVKVPLDQRERALEALDVDG